jgi:hypothetical protein
MEPQAEEKSITVHFVSKLLVAADAATVSFPRAMSPRESEFQIRDGFTATLRIPMRAFQMHMDTTFPDSSRIRVVAHVTGANIDSMRIAQEEQYSVLIDIQHQFGAAEYCTVTCEATGESRTGIGACIDCAGQKGKVRLCC